ncbi:MAG: histidine triad nucleotide-binding protein [Candidatus Caenarcaniphilales bacterium]|nr:histidine triad nucleotide-binding protein [Candidatus Caenarcaniphilales bacterium]
MTTIFERIIKREIPAEIIYEDEQAIVFKDVNPAAPKHFLVVPKEVITSLQTAAEHQYALLSHLMKVIQLVALQEGLAEGGYRVITNIGKDGGQTIDHLHFHVLGGRSLAWTPG